jgi:hypothetical protein
MKRLIYAAAAAAALAAAAVPALAKHDKAMEAQWMCRPAMASEKPTAMMGTKGIECKSMDAMMASAKKGPNIKGMTAAQVDAAWRAWLTEQVVINATAGGGG